jgi:hypothetical protein
MAKRACAGVLFLLLGLSVPFGARSLAGDLAAPSGAVVLTIAGQIGVANRGPVDALSDSVLAYHEKSFEAAAEFDRAMLESLGTHEVELSFEEWPEAYRFSGPKLVDVLSAAGAQGRPITATALDGYAEEISADELASRDWIVALERNGRPLGIGGRGPLWIVYSIPGASASHDDEARWPWAVFFIEVH